MSNEFLNGLQAASNAVAGNVAGPVDILAFLLRKAGMPVPENPIGGSNWMTQKGLMAPVRQGASQVIGETAGLLGPAMVSQFGPQIARGLLKGGENLAAPRTLNPQTGAVVYHGSPHKFDKFDSSKIGTGEGAQAYGHGLYLADAPGVAKDYAEKLSSTLPTEINVNGKSMNFRDAAAIAFGDESANALAASGADKRLDVWFNLRNILNGKGHNSEVFPGNLYKVDLPDEKIARMLDWDAPLSQQAPEMRAAMAHKSAAYTGPEYTADELINAMLEGRTLPSRQIAQEQISSLSQALGMFREKNMLQKPPTGEQVYRALADQYGHDKAASLLREAGIPGIRYLDGGSRAQNVVDARLLSMYEKHGGNAEAAVDEFMRGIYNTPKKKAAMREQFLTQLSTRPTRNYVVFPGEENALTILERNGGLLGP